MTDCAALGAGFCEPGELAGPPACRLADQPFTIFLRDSLPHN